MIFHIRKENGNNLPLIFPSIVNQLTILGLCDQLKKSGSNVINASFFNSEDHLVIGIINRCIILWSP